jgi:hypothetical protein
MMHPLRSDRNQGLGCGSPGQRRAWDAEDRIGNQAFDSKNSTTTVGAPTINA